MHRRTVLKGCLGALGVSSLSGCTNRLSPDSNGETEPQSTPTETTTTKATPTETVTSETTAAETPTASPTPPPSETPVPFPETCQSLPDIDGLPDPPSELTEDSVETFVSEFERVYALATTDEYGGVKSLQIQSVEFEDERYIVRLSFDAVPATSTPDADGETPTPLPVDAYTHRAVYRLTADRMLRELRSHIDDSLLSQTCWTLENE